MIKLLKKLILKQTPTLEALEAFVFKDSLPLVSHMSPKNQHLIFDKIKPICYVIYDIDIELRTCEYLCNYFVVLTRSII